jgi:hypothetical protein
MWGGKRYGEAKIAACPFCGAGAYSKNKDGVPVCAAHKNSSLGEMKCACGEWLDMRQGKWGPFFLCSKCGPVNMTKALSTQSESGIAKKAPAPAGAQEKKKHPMLGGSEAQARRSQDYLDGYGKDKWIRSDDPRFEFK